VKGMLAGADGAFIPVRWRSRRVQRMMRARSCCRRHLGTLRAPLSRTHRCHRCAHGGPDFPRSPRAMRRRTGPRRTPRPGSGPFLECWALPPRRCASDPGRGGPDAVIKAAHVEIAHPLISPPTVPPSPPLLAARPRGPAPLRGRVRARWRRPLPQPPRVPEQGPDGEVRRAGAARPDGRHPRRGLRRRKVHPRAEPQGGAHPQGADPRRRARKGDLRHRLQGRRQGLQEVRVTAPSPRASHPYPLSHSDSPPPSLPPSLPAAPRRCATWRRRCSGTAW
jgi:hypothetical protein